MTQTHNYIDRYDIRPEKDHYHSTESPPPPDSQSTVDMVDDVNRPSHYKLWGKTEAIDLIKEILTDDEYKGYLKGNILKYRLRAGKKNNAEKDIAKAIWYEGELNSCKGKDSVTD